MMYCVAGEKPDVSRIFQVNSQMLTSVCQTHVYMTPSQMTPHVGSDAMDSQVTPACFIGQSHTGAPADWPVSCRCFSWLADLTQVLQLIALTLCMMLEVAVSCSVPIDTYMSRWWCEELSVSSSDEWIMSTATPRGKYCRNSCHRCILLFLRFAQDSFTACLSIFLFFP